MTALPEQILITSLWIWGFYAATREGEILGFIKYYGDKYIKNEWIIKPTYGCPICMASVHSIGLSFYYFGWNWHTIIILITGTAGLNYVINRMLPKEE